MPVSTSSELVLTRLIDDEHTHRSEINDQHASSTQFRQNTLHDGRSTNERGRQSDCYSRIMQADPRSTSRIRPERRKAPGSQQASQAQSINRTHQRQNPHHFQSRHTDWPADKCTKR